MKKIYSLIRMLPAEERDIQVEMLNEIIQSGGNLKAFESSLQNLIEKK